MCKQAIKMEKKNKKKKNKKKKEQRGMTCLHIFT